MCTHFLVIFWQVKPLTKNLLCDSKNIILQLVDVISSPTTPTAIQSLALVTFTESLDSLEWAGLDLHAARPVPNVAEVRLPQVRK